MASNEKKEILQNAPFAVIAGMLMGGPAGAIAAGATAVGLAAVQEKHDQEIRQRQWEMQHPDPIRKYEERKNKDDGESIVTIKFRIRDLMKSNNENNLVNPLLIDFYTKEYYDLVNEYYTSDIKDVIRTRLCNEEEKILCRYEEAKKDYRLRTLGINRKKEEPEYFANIIADPYKTDREEYDSNGYCRRVRPDRNPYVLVTLYATEKVRQIYYQKECICKDRKGKMLTMSDFEKSLLRDYHNPNIQKYIIQRSGSSLSGTNACFMYTIDGGNNFYVCYGNYDRFNR